MGDELPIYRYTLTLTSGDEITADAIACREDGPWIILDDSNGTVLSIRTDAVTIIRRGDPVGSATVERM